MKTAAIRLSELREKINNAALHGGLEESELRALQTESIELEQRYRQELLNEEPAERRELRALHDRVEVRNYLTTAAAGASLDGAERELNEQLNLRGGAGTLMPHAALLPPGDRLEVRADVVTNVGDTVGGREQDEILRRVFASTASAFLGVQMRSVDYGEPNYPVLSEGAAGTQAAEGTAVDAAAATITGTTLPPYRLTARYLFSVEDARRVKGLEETLRADLSGALGEAMDLQTLTGNGAAPNVEGFFDALTAPSDPGDTATAAHYIAGILGSVDGRYAMQGKDVRLLTGADTYEKMGVLISGTSDTVLEKTSALSDGVKVSAHVPAASSNIQAAIAVAGLGHMSAVCPIWEGVELIRDPYTGASSGQVAVTAIQLWNFKIIRTAPYKYLKFKIA